VKPTFIFEAKGSISSCEHQRSESDNVQAQKREDDDEHGNKVVSRAVIELVRGVFRYFDASGNFLRHKLLPHLRPINRAIG
jgi:hypothetical protein